MEIIVKNNIENQHRKSTLKINIENTALKINIGNRLTKKKQRYFHVACRYHRPGCLARMFPAFLGSCGLTPNEDCLVYLYEA